jgi:mRNA turnover protein 4
MSEQAQILKLTGLKMVTFGLLARWESTTGEVVQIEGRDIPIPMEEIEPREDAAEMSE